jgi:hypothetical protein
MIKGEGASNAPGATALRANELAANILRCLQKNEEFQSLSAEIDGITYMCVLTGEVS